VHRIGFHYMAISGCTVNKTQNLTKDLKIDFDFY